MTESDKPNKSNPDASLGKQVMAGGLATVTVFAGEKLLFKMAKHPILIFGLGMIAGGAVYKHRKVIIASANKTIDAGKQLVLEQKERALDLIAEVREEQA
jgi:hypothetical protein